MSARVLVGCSGWSYPDWVGPFYAPGAPAEQWLEAYARVFPFVEIDSTFYAEPPVERVRAWVSRTPPGFVFSPKVPRTITHDAKLRNVGGLVASFLKALEPMRAAGKLGPVVLQLPPSFRYDLDAEALASFAREWPRAVPLAVELRHASWWREETYAALREARATLVWSTNETGRAPAVRTTDAAYVRFVGDRALEPGEAKGGAREAWGGEGNAFAGRPHASPSPPLATPAPPQAVDWSRVQREQEEEWVRWRDVLREASEELDFLYFSANNHFMGFAPETARRAAGLLGAPVPDLALAARGKAQRGLADFGGAR